MSGVRDRLTREVCPAMTDTSNENRGIALATCDAIPLIQPHEHFNPIH
jgi:hypothetical protein